MSIRLMTLVWDIEFPTQSQKLIMLKLADYASDAGGSVFPATETIADKVGCDERTVQRVLKAFRDVGLLHLVRAGGNKPGATNEWQINVAMLGWIAGKTIKLVGHGGELEIEGTIPENTPGNLSPSMGDITPGNLSPWVTNPAKGVTPVSSTPGTIATQSVNNHQIDSSRANERASDRARAPSVAKTDIVLTINDPSWSHWMAWLSDHDYWELIAAAEDAQRMITASRWPTDKSPVPRVDRLQIIERRKLGGGV